MEAIERILASDERQVIAIKAEPSVLAEIGEESPAAPGQGLGARPVRRWRACFRNRCRCR